MVDSLFRFTANKVKSIFPGFPHFQNCLTKNKYKLFQILEQSNAVMQFFLCSFHWRGFLTLFIKAPRTKSKATKNSSGLCSRITSQTPHPPSPMGSLLSIELLLCRYGEGQSSCKLSKFLFNQMWFLCFSLVELIRLPEKCRAVTEYRLQVLTAWGLKSSFEPPITR